MDSQKIFWILQCHNYNEMKRKLDANDVPAPAENIAGSKEESTFASLELDPRLLQAIAKQNYKAPTLVQSKAIPLALNGRDVLARAKTGSGKTAAYLLPILHSILKSKQVGLINLCQRTRLTFPSPPQLDLPPPLYLYQPENSQSKSSKLSKHSPPLLQRTYELSISHRRFPMPFKGLCWQTSPTL